MAARVNKWLFLTVVSVTVMLEFGFMFSFGAFYLALLDKYRSDRSSTATVHSLLVGVTLSFGVVSGAIITRLGVKRAISLSCILAPVGLSASFFASSIQYLYVSIGIVAAMGISLSYISGIVVTGRVFTGKQRVAALAIMNSSHSVGGMVYPYLFDALIKAYGINGAFLILGGLFCNSFPFCFLCWTNSWSLETPERHENAQQTQQDQTIQTTFTETRNGSTLNPGQLEEFDGPDKAVAIEMNHQKPEYIQKESKLLSMKKSKNRILNYLQSLLKIPYVTILLGTGLAISSLNGYLVIVLDIARWKGLTDAQGISSFVFYNISSFMARLIPAFLKQFKGVSSFSFLIFAALSACVGQVLIYMAQGYAVFIVATCLIGIAIGGLVSTCVILVVKLVPAEHVPVGSGLMFSVIGALSVGVGPLFGRLRDTTGSYNAVLLIIGIGQLLGILLFVVALVVRRQQNAKIKPGRVMSVFTVTRL